MQSYSTRPVNRFKCVKSVEFPFKKPDGGVRNKTEMDVTILNTSVERKRKETDIKQHDIKKNHLSDMKLCFK